MILRYDSDQQEKATKVVTYYGAGRSSEASDWISRGCANNKTVSQTYCAEGEVYAEMQST